MAVAVAKICIIVSISVAVSTTEALAITSTVSNLAPTVSSVHAGLFGGYAAIDMAAPNGAYIYILQLQEHIVKHECYTYIQLQHLIGALLTVFTPNM